MIPYEQFLLRSVQASGQIMVLTAENRGHMRSVPPLLGNRFLDVGIAEQTMIGMAAGLATRGNIVFTHALAAFLTLRAFEFIRDDVALPRLPVFLIGMVPGVLSDANGPTHQAIDDVGLMRGLPGMRVFCPADEEDMILGLDELIHDPAPTYVRYTNAPSASEHESFRIGAAEITSEQQPETADVTILTYGVLHRQATLAASILHTHGVSTCVVNMRMLSPVDDTVVRRAARSATLVVTLEDHLPVHGLTSVVANILMREQMAVPVLPITLSSWFKPALLPDVLVHEELRGDFVAATVLARLTEIHEKTRGLLNV